MLVRCQEARQDVRALVISRRHGIDALLDAEEAELGEGRAFEFLVGEDFRAGGMIERDKLDLVEIGDLAQFLGDTDFVAAVAAARARAPGICTYSS